ncbi:hypothetical protein ACJRO7_026089 [Eucalyptus globulus]|uniref:Uncharacterized protein n=1 Tax=Eucalyptus globulus TaxID=34317 RepID=A0ABD3KG10_EUCGL
MSSASWNKHKCLLLVMITLVAFTVSSEASRVPKEYWEQMLPKKFPTPSSSPSRGTNSVSASASVAVKMDQAHPSSDGKV